MKLPKIVSSSMAFSDVVLPAMGIPLHTADSQLLVSINSMWSDVALAEGITNIPRIDGWELSYPTHIVRPYVPQQINKPLRQICDDRARAILATGKQIVLFWSGGIDSTLALSAILANLTNPDQVVVYHTCDSLLENPEYVSHINKHNVKLVSWSDAWVTLFDPNCLLVTGTTSDQITASIDESFIMQYNYWLFKPWQDYFKFRGMPDKDICQYENKLIQQGCNIKTVIEARWWFYFYIRHQVWVVKDWLLNLENTIGKSAICFFDCNEFDDWSEQHKSNFFGMHLPPNAVNAEQTNWKKYKTDFKKQIHQYWPNTEYRDNKVKANSKLLHFWMTKKLAWFNQGYLFVYLDKNNQYRTFRPRFYPIIDAELVLEDLYRIQDEI